MVKCQSGSMLVDSPRGGKGTNDYNDNSDKKKRRFDESKPTQQGADAVKLGQHTAGPAEGQQTQDVFRRFRIRRKTAECEDAHRHI